MLFEFNVDIIRVNTGLCSSDTTILWLWIKKLKLDVMIFSYHLKKYLVTSIENSSCSDRINYKYPTLVDIFATPLRTIFKMYSTFRNT